MSVYRRGITWTARVTRRGPDGERQQKAVGGFRLRKEAEQKVDELNTLIRWGYMVAPDQRTVKRFLDGWLDHLLHVVGRKPSTAAGYRGYIGRYVEPTIGARKMQDIHPADIDAICRRA